MPERVDGYTVFCGHHRIVSGALTTATRAAKHHHDARPDSRLVVYEDATGRVVELDLRGTEQEVLNRLAAHPLLSDRPKDELRPPARRGPGRPKLGVVSREVSLLPRHWEWLSSRSGGASAELRRLVHRAMQEDPGSAKVDAVHRFLWDMAGDFQNFEEVTRSLFARDWPTFKAGIAGWPEDVAQYVLERIAALEPTDPPSPEPPRHPGRGA